MENWIPKKNFLIFVISIAVCCVLIYFASVLVIQKELVKIKNAHEDIESELFRTERIKAIETMVLNNTDSIEDLRNFFIKKDDEIKFIEYIETTAKEAQINFEINTITTKKEEADQIKEDILVKVTARGSWNNLMIFLDKMEKSYFGVLVKEVEMDSHSSNDWFASVLFNFYKEL